MYTLSRKGQGTWVFYTYISASLDFFFRLIDLNNGARMHDELHQGTELSKLAGSLQIRDVKSSDLDDKPTCFNEFYCL